MPDNDMVIPAGIDLRTYAAERRQAITDLIKPLLAEAAQLDRVIWALNPGERQLRKGHNSPNGISIQDAILGALENIGRPVLAGELLIQARVLYGAELDRTSVAPQMSRLKEAGRIIHDGKHWALTPEPTP